MTQCVFCTRNYESLFEDDFAAVVLHEDWATRGHVMVVAKKHVENVSDLTEEEWLHFARAYHRTERVLLEVTKADRAIMMKLGIATPHLHIHIYPVGTTATRAEVMEMIDTKRRDAYDAGFIDALHARLKQPEESAR